jgi:hypothetical protein
MLAVLEQQRQDQIHAAKEARLLAFQQQVKKRVTEIEKVCGRSRACSRVLNQDR